MVASYHGDHVYCFDVTGAAAGAGTTATLPMQGHNTLPLATAAAAEPSQSTRLDFFLGGDFSSSSSGGSGGGGGGGRRSFGSSRLAAYRGVVGIGAEGEWGEGGAGSMLPAAAEAAKAEGNLHFFNKQVRRA